MDIEKQSTNSSDIEESASLSNEGSSFEEVLSKTKKLQEQKDLNLNRRMCGEISGVELDTLNGQIDAEIKEIENQFTALYKVETHTDGEEDIVSEESIDLLSNAEKFRVEKEKPPFEKAIQKCTCIEELIEEVLPKIASVSDERGIFTSDELKNIIYKAYTRKISLNEVPLTYGLRTKVLELQEVLNKESLEGPKIQFPEDLQTVRALQKKLQEYKERLGEEMKNDPYKTPEMFTDTTYKIAVLEKLLLQGEVDTHALSREIHEKFGNLNTSDFDNACSVIEDYAKTSGKHTTGGTGLIIEEEKESQPNESNLATSEDAVKIDSVVNDESADTTTPEDESFSSEKNKEQEVASVKDFGDLITNVINRHSDWKYSNGENLDTTILAKTINAVRAGSATLNHITSRYGLRTKVAELLEREREVFQGGEVKNSGIESPEEKPAIQEMFEKLQNKKIKNDVREIFRANLYDRMYRTDWEPTTEDIERFLQKWPSVSAFDATFVGNKLHEKQTSLEQEQTKEGQNILKMEIEYQKQKERDVYPFMREVLYGVKREE
jgi:hypothetical protein